MTRLISVSRALALLALAALFFSLAVTLWRLPEMVNNQLSGLRNDANAQATVTRDAVIGLLAPVAHGASLLPEIADRRMGNVTATLDRAVVDADQRLGQAIDAASGRLGDGIDVANVRLGESTAAIAKLAGVRDDLQPAFANVGLLTGDVRAAIAPELACKGNGVCWPSQVTGIMGSTKTLLGEGALTARYVRKETPETVANIREITGNGVKISKPHWYWKVAPLVGGVIVGIITAKSK